MKNLNQTEVEDVEEEDDCRCYQAIKRKKATRSGKWVRIDLYHVSGVDLSELGLRGSLKPADFGWDAQNLPKL